MKREVLIMAAKKTSVEEVKAKAEEQLTKAAEETKAAAKKVSKAAKAKAAELKENAPEEVVKTAAKAKTAAKTTATKAKKTVKKAVEAVEPKQEPKVFYQALGNEIDLVAAAKADYEAKGHKVSEIKALEIYVKPEDGCVYYAVNGNGGEDQKFYL